MPSIKSQAAEWLIAPIQMYSIDSKKQIQLKI
jgi:hypothetical protein